MNNVTNLKEMPYHTTKSGLVAMYLNQMPEKDILRQINTIIVEKRKLKPGTTPKNIKVWHVELKEFVETFGLPQGYKIPEWIEP